MLAGIPGVQCIHGDRLVEIFIDFLPYFTEEISFLWNRPDASSHFLFKRASWSRTSPGWFQNWSSKNSHSNGRSFKGIGYPWCHVSSGSLCDSSVLIWNSCTFPLHFWYQCIRREAFVKNLALYADSQYLTFQNDPRFVKSSLLPAFIGMFWRYYICL